ncbi:MAG TPA: hypothetical protein VMU90_01015 [Solirubrobacteraceae bacterium]|nr:hypothetical protein [Solirubrobacteraceae bacterium]
MMMLLATAEPSKVPFYLLGAVLALWAVLLAGVGLTRPSFPFGAVGQRLIMVVSLGLATAAVLSAVLTSR